MQLYTRGKNTLYWQLIDKLNRYIYNKDWNVIPYMPEKEFLFVDFWPELYVEGTDTFIKVYINGDYFTTCKIVDEIGTIYFTKKVDYGITKIRLTDIADNRLADYEFIALNTYLYYELLGDIRLDRLIELLRIKNDIFLDEVRDAQLYSNFGYLFDLRKPSDFTFEEYRNIILDLRTAFLNGSTYKGIKLAVKSITGTEPDIIPYEAIEGWKVYNNPKWVWNGTNWEDTDSNRNHYYVEGNLLNTRAKPGIKIYSKEQHINWIKLKVYDSTRNVVNEEVVKTEENGGSDSLNNQYLTSTLVAINQGANIYTEGVEFTVDRINGKINWIVGQPQPNKNSTYLVSYQYIVKKIVEQVCENLKPAYTKIIYLYV